jgi:hypothetical protein
VRRARPRVDLRPPALRLPAEGGDARGGPEVRRRGALRRRDAGAPRLWRRRS